MIYLRRYFAALFVLLALYGGYALAVAPWMEPPPIRPKAPVAALPPVQIPDPIRADLQELFPPDSWQRDFTKVKVMETGQATLVIQDYIPTPDGKLELRPCTIIFYAASGAASDSPGLTLTANTPSRRRPIVLDVPQGVTLEFDHPLDMAQSQWGRVRKGTLAGPITIRSPASGPGSRDELYLTTRDVRLDRDLVMTPHEVEFRYGDSFGRGSNLSITLLNSNDDKISDNKKKPRGKSFVGVQLLKLNKLDHLQIVGAGEMFGGSSRGKGQTPQDAGSPLELTCRGPFSFDMVRQSARFDERVQVLRTLPGAPPDRLLCETLVLDFAQRMPADAAKTTPSAISSDPLGNRLKRLLAVGNPAVIESPSRAMKGVAASIEYLLENRRLTLTSHPDPGAKTMEPVSLHQAGQHFVAKELQYESGAPGKMGRLWAAGPGELRMVQGQGLGNQPIVGRWERELRVRPHEKNQLISLQGAASVSLESESRESQARLDADELHLWAIEEPETSLTKSSHSMMRPDRLLANGRVRLTSPQLDAETSRLEAWFLVRPGVPGPAAEAAVPAAPVVRPETANVVRPETAITLSAPRADEAVIRQPNPQKFRVRGEKIQLQLVGQERKFELDELFIDERAAIDELCTPEHGQLPIHIAGDRIELKGGTTPQSIIKVTGKQAQAGGRGMSLVGDVIHVNRGQNRLWIDGMGEATLPAPPAGGGDFLPLPAQGGELNAGAGGFARPRPAGGAPQTIKLDWRDGLVFDGQSVTLKGQVNARSGTQRTESATLEAVLSQRVDMTNVQTGPKAELARVIWLGGVFVENRGVDELGNQISLDQMRVPTLMVDRLAGKMQAAGPGWVHTVRRSTAEKGQPGTSRPVAQQVGGPVDKPLTNIHVAFERAIEGDLAKREIEFQEQVQTTYATVANFTDFKVAEAASDLGPQDMLLTSNRLILKDMVISSARWMELEAKDNAYMEGRSIKVQAASIRYSGDKEVVTITGDGRADAIVWYQAAPGQTPSKAVVQKCRYFLRTGAWESDGIKHFDLRDLNQFHLQGLKPGPAR